MDSDDSRSGSSASDSSGNASDNSRQSSPSPPPVREDNPKSPTESVHSIASPQSSNSRRSRPRTRYLNPSPRSPQSRSLSKSDSESRSSSSSENDNDEVKSLNSPRQTRSKGSSGRSSSEDSVEKRHSASRTQSTSPAKSDHSSGDSRSSSNQGADGGINISHEDLSDVSDMESEKRISSVNNSKQSLVDDGTNMSMGVGDVLEDPETSLPKRNFPIEGENSNDAVLTDLRQKLDQKKNQQRAMDISQEKSNDTGKLTPNGNSNGNSGECLEDFVKAHDEDALDFEAEEGECLDISKEDEKNGDTNADSEIDKKKSNKSGGEAEKGEELEEGEVSDEDEKRPEETEPKPVCRFYTRGQCTWGMSCRFLHPGVTDKGNYTMFDLVRPVPVPQAGVPSRASSFPNHGADYHDFRTERPPLIHRAPMHHPAAVYPGHHETRGLLNEPVAIESAWERGLRTAKEMMRKANKRKEQDMDFEDKKMNLTLSPDELEKDPYYLKERETPPDVIPPYGRHGPYQEAAAGLYSPTDRFGRGPPVSSFDEVDPYGRTTRYRELPPHRMPQYEDERRVRPTREVIVQRVDPVGRGDEWSDPWMRSKSPGGRGVSRERTDKRRRDRRSYSSNTTYTTSSSSNSDSSSDSSRSLSPAGHRRRYNSSSHKSPQVVRRHGVRSVRSPSPPPRRSRHSPGIRHQSPTVKRRAHITPSPTGYSPSHKRKKLSPISKKTINDKHKAKHRRSSSSSGSGSSDSSGSESDSDSGSSSSSTSRSRKKMSSKKTRILQKAINEKKLTKRVEPPKKRSPISIEIKKQATVGASALTSPTHSVSSEKGPKKTRREELLKQLRAVEDAIAKKRSKLT